MAEWSKETFANNLQFYLSQSGKTQKELAKIIGVSAPTMHEWCSGKKTPRMDKVERLANYFGILKSDLIEDKRGFLHIGSTIRAARIAKGLTQEELGKLLGVQKSAIAKYENGRIVNIKRSTLQKISDILGIHPSELFFDGNQPQPVEDDLSDKKKKFIQRIHQMSDAQLDRLEQILAIVENTDI